MRRAAKILFVTPYFAPDYAACSPMYLALCEDLSRMGHKVTVLTGMPYYGKEKVWDEYRGKFLVQEKSAGYRIIRFYSFVARRTNTLGRVFSWGLFNIFSSIAGILLGRHDVLYATNPFTMSGLPLHLLSRLKGMHSIYAVDDIYPDALFRAGVLKKGWLSSLIGLAELSCYRTASRIAVLSEGMHSAVVLKGAEPEKIAILPYFADTDFVRPLPRLNAFREKNSLNDKFVVLYAGNLGTSQGLECILEAADLLRSKSDIMFVFVGEGASREALQKMARERGLPNVRFIPFQPREDVPWVLASADVSLITLKGDFGSESMPSKTYWNLASGRPILAAVGKSTEVAKLILQGECGVQVDPDSPAALAEAVLEFHRDQTKRELMGIQARNLAVEHYSRAAAAKRFDALVQQLLQ